MADLLHWGLALAAVIAAGSALLVHDPRRRVVAMSVAIALAPALVAVESWDDERLRDLRSNPPALVFALVGGAALIAALAALIRRRPAYLALLAVAALPFRVPLEAGGDSANLLLPLYVVIAAGVLATWLRPARAAEVAGEGAFSRAVRWLPAALAGSLLLYTVQGVYSGDFENAAAKIGFFFVPFAVLAALLVRVEWSPRLLTLALGVAVAEAILFAFVGFGQYAVRDLFWNPAIIEANELHAYFRVNSLFWDPNIFGRYLAVTIVAVAAAMIWEPRAGRTAAWGAVALVLLVALATTLSQSSLIALLAGLAVLAALRWSALWTGVACGAALLAVIVAFAASGKLELGSEKSLNVQTSGRAELIRGGLELAETHPIAGRGSGSFEEEFKQRFRTGDEAATDVSHTEPVTVAAEQGTVGFIAYIAVLVLAAAALASGIRAYAPGLRRGGAVLADDERRVVGVARAALLAALLAMIVHSLSYAAFFTDPITWTLFAIGLALTGRRE